MTKIIYLSCMKVDLHMDICDMSASMHSNFSCRFLNSNYMSNLNSNSNKFNVLDLRNILFQKSNTVRINCSTDLKLYANSQCSASNFNSFSQSLEQFFLTVDQNNFGNKIPYVLKM